MRAHIHIGGRARALLGTAAGAFAVLSGCTSTGSATNGARDASAIPGPDGGRATLGDADVGPSLDAATDAADGGRPYDPCPAAGTPCRIMPLGDSITFGVNATSYGGYRVPLFHAALAAQQSITFVGSSTSGPTMVDGVAFPQANEGHSGFTIDDGGGRSGIQPLVVNAIQTHHPHIVTLMIGTNDVDIQLDLAHASTRLATLIDTIVTTDPTLLLVVAKITPTTDDTENMRVMTYNGAIDALVSTRAAQGKHVQVVDMYAAITADPAYKTKFYSDNLHPNDAGFVVMGGVWYAAIGSLLR